MTIQPDYDRLYNLDDNRYKETLLQFQQQSIADDQKIVLLMRLATKYGFTCSQVWNLINIFNDDPTKIQGLQALMNNIIDLQNKDAQIIDQFVTDFGKSQSQTLLANVTACQTQGDAPNIIPYPTLNYTNTWNDSDVYALIDQINRASSSDQKISIAQTALLNQSNVLTPNQTLWLFQAFTTSKDIITLANAVNERIISLTCDQVQKILAKFILPTDKLNILTAFKSSVLDTENKYNLLSSLILASDKDKARLILDQFRAKSSLFGAPSGKVGLVVACSASMATNITLSTGETLTRLQYAKREFEKTLLNFGDGTQFDFAVFGGGPVVWNPVVKDPSSQNVLDALNLLNSRGPQGAHDIFDPYYFLVQMTDAEVIYIITDALPDCGATSDPAAIINLTKTWHQNLQIKVHTIGLLMGDDGQSPENKTQVVAFLKAMADATNSTFRILE